MALLQDKSQVPGTATIAFASNVATGSVILVWQVRNTYAGAPVISYSSGSASMGTPVSIVSLAGDATYGGCSLYAAPITSGGSLTVAIADSSAVHISEWSSINTSDVVEDSDGAGATGTALSLSALSTAGPCTVVFFYGKYVGGYPTNTPDSGFSAFSSNSGNCAGGVYAVGVAAGSPDPGTTVSSSQAYRIASVAMNESASATKVSFIL